MAGAFPTLKNGTTVLHPLKDTHSFGTKVIQFDDDSEQRWRCRLMLRRFELQLNGITGRDVSLVRQFFRSQFGRFDNTWTLTYAGTTHSNMAFDQDELAVVEDRAKRFNISLKVVQTISADPSIPAQLVRFPQINSTGIITGLPYSHSMNYRTTADELENGKRTVWKERSNPVWSFELMFPALTDAELAIVQSCFYACEGRLRTFIFVDPGGNMVNYSDDYSHSSWTKSGITVGSAVSDPFGGSAATSLAGSAGDPYMLSEIYPASKDGSGMVITASAWVKSSSATTLRIGLTDGAGWTSSSDRELPAGQWTRIHHTATVPNDNAVSIIIGGFGSFASKTVHVIGAQAVAMPGPGARVFTPGGDALHLKCRFDTDDFTQEHIGPNETKVVLPITEIA